MDLSTKTSTFHAPKPTDIRAPQRAGVRVAPARSEPTSLFEAIEMAVLVIVAALTMVSIIVASVDDDSRQRVEAANATVERHPESRDPGRAAGSTPIYASVDSNRSSSDSAGR